MSSQMRDGLEPTQQAVAARSAFWRDAVSYLGRSALQLHHYRSLRTRLLHDSLRKLERDACGGRTTDL